MMSTCASEEAGEEEFFESEDVVTMEVRNEDSVDRSLRNAGNAECEWA